MSAGRWSHVPAILLLGAVSGLLIVLALKGLDMPLHGWHAAIPLWFTLLSLALHTWQESGMDHDPKGFVRRVMAGMAFKMFSSLILLVVALVALPREEVLATAIAFILAYLLFLGYSVVRYSKLLRGQRNA